MFIQIKVLYHNFKKEGMRESRGFFVDFFFLLFGLNKWSWQKTDSVNPIKFIQILFVNLTE